MNTLPNYWVEALDAQGAPHQQRIEAESPHAAILALREEGFHVYAVRPTGLRRMFGRAAAPLSAEELCLLSEQLATLVEGGLPISPALKDLAGDLRSRRLRKILQEAQQEVEQGQSLEAAFGRHAGQLPPIFLAMIRAGEQTGNLPAVLRQLTDYTQGLLRLKYRLQAIFAYPLLLFVFLFLFLSVFVTAVLPQFAEIYNAFGHRLPGSTLIVLQVGWLLLVLGYPLIFLAFLGLMVTLMLGHVTPLRSVLGLSADYLKLRLPVVGGLYRTVLAARFCRTLGTLLDNGVGAVEALQLAGAAAGNRVYARTALEAAARVAQGISISQAIEGMELLRHSACWILKHGESHGLFEQTLLRVADTADRDAERREQRLLGVLGPGMVWTFGIVVGFVTTALYMPILRLSQLIY